MIFYFPDHCNENDEFNTFCEWYEPIKEEIDENSYCMDLGHVETKEVNSISEDEPTWDVENVNIKDEQMVEGSTLNQIDDINVNSKAPDTSKFICSLCGEGETLYHNNTHYLLLINISSIKFSIQTKTFITKAFFERTYQEEEKRM